MILDSWAICLYIKEIDGEKDVEVPAMEGTKSVIPIAETGNRTTRTMARRANEVEEAINLWICFTQREGGLGRESWWYCSCD